MRSQTSEVSGQKSVVRGQWSDVSRQDKAASISQAATSEEYLAKGEYTYKVVSG